MAEVRLAVGLRRSVLEPLNEHATRRQIAGGRRRRAASREVADILMAVHLLVDRTE
jgi:hypothetical protein